MREPVNAQKQRTGLSRMLHAFGYSMAGLRAGWAETAFRQEALAAFVLLPLAFWLGQTWVEVALLAGSVVLVPAGELHDVHARGDQGCVLLVTIAGAND